MVGGQRGLGAGAAADGRRLPARAGAGVHAAGEKERQVGPAVGPTAAFSGCIPTGMHGPTCIFWANLTTGVHVAAPRRPARQIEQAYPFSDRRI